MNQSLIRFPITCPRCGHESLTEFRAVVVTIATVEWHSMRLYAPCHKVFWDASDLELEQIGAYLGASWIGASSIASQESDHQDRVTVAQNGMIFSIMRSVGLTNLSEGDIETQAYLSKKFVERDKVYIDSMRALPEIAATIKKHSDPPKQL